MLEEGLESLNLLLSQKEASFKGRYLEYQGVSLHPKPIQKPFPIYLAGNHPETPRRVARWCSGWIMSVSTSQETVKDRIEKLRPLIEQEGRDQSEIDMTVIGVLSVAKSHGKAVERFKNSRVLKRSEGQSLEDFIKRNLIGTADEIIEKIGRLRDEGTTHILMANRANNIFGEMAEQVQMVGEEILPAFR